MSVVYVCTSWDGPERSEGPEHASGSLSWSTYGLRELVQDLPGTEGTWKGLGSMGPFRDLQIKHFGVSRLSEAKDVKHRPGYLLWAMWDFRGLAERSEAGTRVLISLWAIWGLSWTGS